MIKTAARSIALLALSAAAPALAQNADSAAAQSGPQSGPQAGDEKINQLIIYGDDPCPKSGGDEIVVCARFDEEQRFRIPSKLRSDPNARSKEPWTQRVKAYEYVAASGIGSCSASGFGGFTGCGIRDINAAALEKAEDPGLAFGRLIAQARQQRLSGIDAEANEIEDIVLAEERAAALKKLQDQADSVAADTQTGGADDEPLPDPN